MKAMSTEKKKKKKKKKKKQQQWLGWRWFSKS
jgi:hypothetical protein